MFDYNEDLVLTEYMWCNYRHLLTSTESVADRVALARFRLQQMPEQLAQVLQTWDRSDAEVDQLLKDGEEFFRRRVRERLLRECRTQVFINRCPACLCIVRMPRTQLCNWCGYDRRYRPLVAS